jgi:hypothetical protein
LGAFLNLPSGRPSKVNCERLTPSHTVFNIQTRPKCS